MKNVIVALGLMISVSAVAKSYSAEEIYASLAAEEYAVRPEVFNGRIFAKSVGGLTCIKSLVDSNKANYVCGVDDNKYLESMAIWSTNILEH